MAKATLSEIMRRAHQLAKQMEGDYQARLALGLRIAWAEYKGGAEVEKGFPQMEGSEKQVKWAEDIRAALARCWEELMQEYGEAPEIVQKYMEGELNQTKAKYFIEVWRYATRFNRYDLAKVLSNKDGEIGDAAFDWEFDAIGRRISREKLGAETL